MTNLLKFPDKGNVYHRNLERGLRKLELTEVMEAVFLANMEMLDVTDSPDPSEHVEFFHVSDYPGLYLVDVDCPQTKTRGLFTVDPETFELLIIAPEPLVHFTGEEYNSE